MRSSYQSSMIQKLNRAAAYRVLHRKDECVLTNAGRFLDESSTLTCECGECLLARSILHGRKLNQARQGPRLGSISTILTTPGVLKAFALAGLDKSITILFFSFTLSLPFTLTPVLAKPIQISQPAPSGFPITRELISEVSRLRPVLRIPAPTNLHIITSSPSPSK